MIQLKKTILTLVALLAVTTQAWADGSWTSGDCTVTLSGGTLTVSGNGEMYGDYDDVDEKAPWVSSASSITSLVIEDGVTYIGDYAFYNLSALTSVTFGKDVARIDDHAFYKCTSLTEITFPASVKEIGPNILANCSNLTEVTFLATDLVRMENAPFYNCGNLKTINIYAETPCDISSTTFSEIANLEHIYVPAGSVDAYKTAWPNVASYIAAMPAQGTAVNFTRGTGDKINEWTMDGGMPAGNVTVEPEYYAQAMFATEGNEVLTPTAAEDAIAGTDAPLIEEGTVAKAGQTDDAQGQVMYAVTTTADAAPALTAFSATVPTAEDYDDATTVFVWYYIQGADAPTGTVPSDDNTFSDSDISATPLTVNVLPNKFTLTFDPAPVEKVDVTVDGQAATPAQDGKLENVPMGKQVKLTAKTGYKLKKVEVKKGGAAAAKTITIGDMELTYADGDKWETIVSKNSDKIKIVSNMIVQVAQPAPNQYRYIHVWYTEVKPSDIIDPSKNYQWDTMEVNY